MALSGVLCSRPLLISKEKVTVSPSTLKFKGGKCTLKTRHTVFKRAMNFRDLLSKGPQQYFTPFLTCFLNSNSIPSHLDINLSGVSPIQVAFGTSHLWSGSQLANSRIRVKMNQILSIILISTSNFYSFCPLPPSSHHHLTCANKASKWPVSCRTKRQCWKSLLCVVEPTRWMRIKKEKRTVKSAVLIWCRMLGTSPLEETRCLWLN